MNPRALAVLEKSRGSVLYKKEENEKFLTTRRTDQILGIHGSERYKEREAKKALPTLIRYLRYAKQEER